LAPAVPKFTPPGYRRAVFLYAETGKDKIMRNRKQVQSYPANVLQALHLNELLGTNIDYENLTEDQVKGVNYLICSSPLTEREEIILERYYGSAMTAKEIAEEYNLSKKRVQQIYQRALKKLQVKELLLYAAEGFDAHVYRMQEMLKTEEAAYCAARGITDQTHLYYQDIERLNLTVRAEHMMRLDGVQDVRALLLVIASGRSVCVRNFGTGSEAATREILVREGFLPENYEIPVWRYWREPWRHVPLLDIEAMTFRDLNACENGRRE